MPGLKWFWPIMDRRQLIIFRYFSAIIRTFFNHTVEIVSITFFSPCKSLLYKSSVSSCVYSLVHEAKNILREEKGDEPTIAELSEYTKIPENELSDLEDILSPAKG